MNEYRKVMRSVLKQADAQHYQALCGLVKLTETEKKVMDMIYCKGYNLGYIADTLGYSEDWTKEIHKRVLDKITSHFLATTVRVSYVRM